MRFAYDQDADALYVTVSGAVVSRTIEVDPLTMVDVDVNGQLVGIEILRLTSRQVDLDAIHDKTPLPNEVRSYLELLLGSDDYGAPFQAPLPA